MLKKVIGIIALIGMAAGAAVYLSSCAQIAGPLSPDIKRNTASDTAGSGLPQVTIVGYPASLTQTVRVSFDLPLNSSTVTSANVLVYALDTSTGTTEAPVAVTLAYSVAAQQITITPPNGTWTNNTYYRIELTTGICSIAGTQLDGNGNGIAEGSQFDNYHTMLSFGAPPFSYTTKDTAVVHTPLTPSWASNANPAGSTFFFGQEQGYVSAAYSHVTITVQFTCTAPVPADFRMDSSTFFSTASALHPNVVFTDPSNNPVNPLSVTLLTTVYPDDTLVIVFNNLQPTAKYLFKLKGGLNGIRSSNNSAIGLNRNFYFDGDEDGIAEQTDDTKPAVLMTQTNEAQNIPRVYVVSAVWNNALRRYAVTFDVPTGIGTLDPASVTNNNFLLWNNDSQIPIIPASLSLDNSLAPNPVVYVYVPLVISPNGPGTYEVFLTVRKEVKSASGISLDQNNDGVLQTDSDNFQSGSVNIDGF
jgi:hypothetical protein